MASIRKRVLPSGRTTWLVDFKDIRGRRRARQFQTKRQADAFMVQARAEVAGGVYAPDAQRVAVSDAASRWLAACERRRAAGRRMERTTWIGYEAHVRLHICDPDLGIGSMRLAQLTRGVVCEFRDRLLDARRSEVTTRKILSTLSLIVEHARTDGMIAHNPVKGIQVLRTTRIKERARVPQKQDVRLLIDTASDQFRPYLMVAALCGLRASEQRALCWSDIDLGEGLLRVRQRADAFNSFGQPKSNSGQRDVPMGPMVVNTLKRWRLRCPSSSLGLVFPTKSGGVQPHSNVLRRHFKPLCRKNGIEMRWHDLRHFAVSLWIEQDFPPKAIMEFAGHSSIQLTFDLYGHLFPSPEHARGMAEIEARFFG